MKNKSLKIYVEITRKLASKTFHILLRSFGTQKTHTHTHITLYSDMYACRHIPITALCACHSSLKM